MDICSLFVGRFPRFAVERNFSFAKHTTIGCGGNASLAIFPESTEAASAAISFLQREKIPVFLLGAGANVLPCDGFFEGVVVCFRRMRRISSDGTLVCAEAGVTGGALMRFSVASALGGFEPFAGIPMTLGGGTAMNAGVSVLHFSDVIEEVTAIEQGKVRTFCRSECRFSEKDSVFLEGIAVTEIKMRAITSERSAIERNLSRFLERRKNLPKGRSMGCTFVNPKGLSAGRLIEECGLKGISRGGARVSEQHANFILNTGACAADVAELVAFVKSEVRRKTGIVLREEIRRVVPIPDIRST